jgi:hypothetical protein
LSPTIQRQSDHQAPAADPSPYEFAKLLEGRVALEFPSSVIKEEKTSESYDRQSARYVVVWYNNDEQGKEVNLDPRVRALASEVIDADAQAWFNVEVSELQRSKETSQLMITYEKKEKPSLSTKAAVRAAGDAKGMLEAPLEFKVGESSYRVVSADGGTTWDVVDASGDKVESNLASVPAAVGKVLKHVLVDLSYIEEVSGGKTTKKAMDDLDRNFVEALVSWIYNSPVANKEAKKHLKEFIEIVTKHEFQAEKAEKGVE